MPDEENLNVQDEPIPEPEPTPEQIEEWERERAEREAAKLAPSHAAQQQRNTTAEVAAEHDDLIADILYETTINDIGVE